MLHKLVILLFASCSAIASAQIYECQDEKGIRLWTNEPCANGKLLHPGVSQAEQNRALEADRIQRTQRAAKDAHAAERFRQNAYSSSYSSGGYSSSASNKNLEQCHFTRRSLRIEYTKIYAQRNYEKIRQLRTDEAKYC